MNGPARQCLDDYPEYREAAAAWATHRERSRGEALSARQLKKELSVVASWPLSEAVAGIHASIRRGFRHIHPARRAGLPREEEAWMRARAVRDLVAFLRREDSQHSDELREMLYD